LVGDHEFDALIPKAEAAGLDRYSALGYRDTQQASFPDNNNGSYNQSIIRFDTVATRFVVVGSGRSRDFGCTTLWIFEHSSLSAYLLLWRSC